MTDVFSNLRFHPIQSNRLSSRYDGNFRQFLFCPSTSFSPGLVSCLWLGRCIQPCYLPLLYPSTVGPVCSLYDSLVGVCFVSFYSMHAFCPVTWLCCMHGSLTFTLFFFSFFLSSVKHCRQKTCTANSVYVALGWCCFLPKESSRSKLTQYKSIRFSSSAEVHHINEKS